MTNLSIVREACVKANPDILKLEFGCRVKYHPDDLIVTVHLVYWALKALRGTADKEGTSVRQFLIQDCTSLGRPIRLADVLHWNKKRCLELEQYVRHQEEIVEKWNLLQDDLEKQSPECIDFLASLINPSKH